MDVRVDSALIRSEREKRAWSQEHLAGAAGVGARTIQRIEATGVASFESARAVCAALELPLSRLRGDDEPGLVPAPPRRGRRAAKWLGGAVVLAIVAGAGGFFLLHDYQQVRVLRTFEQWVTAPPSAAAQR
jgi:transcriptional regulator with XRE-family HTH domain